MVILFYISLFLYIGATSLQENWVDFDFWARLIVGKTFFQTGQLLNYDFQSFGPTRQWFDHEWGSSLIFYGILDKFGEAGLFAFKTLVIFIVFFLITRIILLRRKYIFKEEGRWLKVSPFNIIFFILIIQATHDFTAPTLRCNQLTFLFFMIWFYTLEKSRLEANYKILWLLPATMIAWSNIHGGCFTGLGLLALYTVGEFLNKKTYKPYAIAFLASIAAMLINPYGLKYVYFLFYAITLNRPNITEWQPLFSKILLPSFIKYKLWSFGIVLITGSYIYKRFKALGSGTFFEKIKTFYGSLDKTKALVLIIMFLMPLKSARTIPFFVFCASVFLYDDIYKKIFTKKLSNLANNLKEILLFLLILISFTYTFKTSGLKATIQRYPYVEAEFLKINNLKGNVLANFHYGSFLAYKLYPNNFIFMDGRYEEAYDPKLLDTLGKIYVGKDWKQTLDNIHIDFIISEKEKGAELFFKNMLENKDWNLVLLTKHFGLFARKDIKFKTIKTPSNDIEYYDKHKWETEIDWKNQNAN